MISIGADIRFEFSQYRVRRNKHKPTVRSKQQRGAHVLIIIAYESSYFPSTTSCHLCISFEKGKKKFSVIYFSRKIDKADI